MSTVSVEIRGIARVVYIMENLPLKLKESLPDALEEFASAVLRKAEEKASSFPITGELWASLTMEVDRESLTARIGPTAPHGPHITFGTRAHWIGANVQVAPGIWRWIGMHPGHGGNPYLEWALIETAPLFPAMLQPYVAKKMLELDGESLPFQFKSEETTG